MSEQTGSWVLGAGQVSKRTEVPSQRSGEGGPGGSTSPCVPDQTQGHFSRNCSEQARNSCQVPSAHHKPRSGAGRASVLWFSCPDNAPRDAATLPWLQMGKLRHEGWQDVQWEGKGLHSSLWLSHPLTARPWWSDSRGRWQNSAKPPLSALSSHKRLEEIPCPRAQR